MTVPPRLMEQLLASLGAVPAFRDPLLGDLAEEHARRAAADGARAAARWYRREALRTAPHLLRDGVHHMHARDVAHLAGVVFSAWVLLQATLALVVLPLLFAALSVLGLTLPELARGRLPWTDPVAGGVALVAGALAATLGGRIAAALYGRAPLVGALALGATWAALALLAGTIGNGIPLWYRATTPAVTLAGATMGGLLAVRALSVRAIVRVARD